VLEGSDEAVELVVGDDGRGFDASSVGADQMGLRIMRERAEAVGASLRIDSEMRRGTVITTTWSAGRG
jgi:signal transduction histidine kinase